MRVDPLNHSQKCFEVFPKEANTSSWWQSDVLESGGDISNDRKAHVDCEVGDKAGDVRLENELSLVVLSHEV